MKTEEDMYVCMYDNMWASMAALESIITPVFLAVDIATT